jgi:hypothetical protein
VLKELLSISSTSSLSTGALLVCMVASLVLGIGVSVIYMYHNAYNKNFVITLAFLPVIVHTVILMVNGNLGTGVAVMGAFSLIRFRSVPGNARDIGSIFLAMAIGLATSTGNLGYALLLFAVVGVLTIILYRTNFGDMKSEEKMLKITIPENLDYEGLFDDLFDQYANSASLIKVKTSNMGSLYELNYHIVLKKPTIDKEFLDALRCRNGNLNIVCGRVSTVKDEI